MTLSTLLLILLAWTALSFLPFIAIYIARSMNERRHMRHLKDQHLHLADPPAQH